jgi:glucose-6-phosphate 1-dehydrogenase
LKSAQASDMLLRMEQAEYLDELLICRLNDGRKEVRPCSIVIFGATGDLTARKLIPALYHLYSEKQMPQPFRVIGVARRPETTLSWAEGLRQALDRFAHSPIVEAAAWESFAANLIYCQGDLAEPATYQQLGSQIGGFDNEELRNNSLFYLATAPSQFAQVVELLHESGLLRKEAQAGTFQRVIIEKPFGHDLFSAQKLNADLTRFLHEKQIFRIDHYLGKETVQNLLIFRFSNAIFEELWTRRSVDHVQITVSEELGVGSRGGYYEETGALRDMVQNHLLQVLALAAMEPPVCLEAESVRDEKVKLLKSIRPILPGQVATNAVRGQYKAGQVNGQPRPGYRQEPKVRLDTDVETFVALRLFIDNWRWSGVPFYLRTGKSLPLSVSEVRVQFRPTPNVLFAAQCGPKLDANSLTIRLQPDEGITLRFNGKIPGAGLNLRPVRMHFSYNSEFGAYTPEAYQRLLLEALTGDATLFIRRDEVEAAWTIVDAIREGWAGQALTEQEFYPAGTWGPPAADELLALRSHAWRNH